MSIYTGDPDERSRKGTLAERTLQQMKAAEESKKRHEERQDGEITCILCGDETVEEKEQDVYLGSLLKHDADWVADFERRKALAFQRFHKLGKILTASCINIAVRIRLLKICVTTVLLYASETSVSIFSLSLLSREFPKTSL